MIPHSVTLKNFLSFGEEQEIRFTDDEPLWCIGGPNGVGKSAIFDAITYCLYGEHRGKGAGTPLIRHGESGFSVSFTFALNDETYRITRNRGKRGQPTQSAEILTSDGDWKPVSNLTGVVDFDAWVVDKLGIGFESFKSSVMLRQGEASNVVDASGAKRHEILSKVIGLERFETVAEKVTEEFRKKKVLLKSLKDRIAGMPEVTPEQIGQAEASQTEAQAACDAADEARNAASRRVADAVRWAEIQSEIAKLEKEIATADERARQAEDIRRKHERFIELEPVLEHLQRWLNVRSEIRSNDAIRSKLLPELRAAEAAHKEAEQQWRDAETRKSLSQTLTMLKGQCSLAEEAEWLSERMSAYPDDLAVQFQSVTRLLDQAVKAERNARDESTKARSGLERAESDVERLKNVEVGVKCSRCGRIVDAKHASEERGIADAEVKQLSGLLQELEGKHREAEEDLSAAEGAVEQLRQQSSECDRLRVLVDANRKNLQAMGITASASELRRQRDDSRSRLEAIPVGTYSEAKLAQAGQQLEQSKQRAMELDTTAATLHARRDAIASILDQRFHATTAEEFAVLQNEVQALRAENVTQQYRELIGDIQRRQDRLERLAEWHAKGDDIPSDARVSVLEAQRIETRTGEVLKHARHELDEAKAALAKLVADSTAYGTVQDQILTAEREERLHDKLAKLLGPGGLQRELMREAEDEIVRHADGIVRNLSNGDLSIELNPSEKKEKEALVLQVRRAESPDPIPVEYLSGSQKFRVAISIALAIGRFATGQTRPLECVIIDEGFGSLDKDGLEATAAELKRLKQYLKRIILVSHQEEFTDHFPCMIRLKPGETGTTVEVQRGSFDFAVAGS